MVDSLETTAVSIARRLFDVYGYGHANAKTFDLIDPAKLYEKGLNDPVGV